MQRIDRVVINRQTFTAKTGSSYRGSYNRLHGNWGEKTLHKGSLEVLVPSPPPWFHCRKIIFHKYSLLKIFRVFNFRMPAN